MQLLAPALLLLALAGPLAAQEINQASAAELDAIRGIGPGLSTPILQERAKAPFRDWKDLMDRIRGIGPGNAARFSAQGLRVNGLAYEQSARPAPPASTPAS